MSSTPITPNVQITKEGDLIEEPKRNRRLFGNIYIKQCIKQKREYTGEAPRRTNKKDKKKG